MIDLRQIDVHEILPQAEPFVMVGSLVHYDDLLTQTETVISPDNIFVEDGRFSAPGLIENIAQTCAARIGYINKYILKRGIEIGFIGGIRDLKIFSKPAVGQKITTSIEIVSEAFGMTMANARIESDGAVLVSAEMKIAIQKEEA